MIYKCGLEISFAYTSFKWDSEAKNKAQVSVIIIGLQEKQKNIKTLFRTNNDQIIETHHKKILPYLIGTDVTTSMVNLADNPLNGLPNMKLGSLIYDDGHYIFTDDGKKEFLRIEPKAEKLFRPYTNAKVLVNNEIKWVLYFGDCQPNELKQLPKVMECVKKVKEFRKNLNVDKIEGISETPLKYRRTRVPTKPFLILPRVSSANRKYIPMTYMKPPNVPTDATYFVESDSVGLFGLLVSNMHMIWLRNIGGKLGVGFRYSTKLVYNTLPLPDKSYKSLEPLAQKILDVRENHKNSTLTDLYDPLTMPDDLRKAHDNLDKAVEKSYRNEAFVDDHDRIKFLLTKYTEMIITNQT